MFGGSKGGAGSTKKSKCGVDEEAIDALFSTFADEDDPDQMGMENIAAFSEKLGVDPMTDVRLLVLMWRLKATTKPGTILRKEFVGGMTDGLRKDSIEGIQSILPSLDPGFLERQEFRDFYKFVFQFQREGTHKTIEKDTVAVLLPMVLDKNRAPHLDYFVEFLKVCSHQRITLDQWDSFLQFQYNVAVDLSNYDEDGACTCCDCLITYAMCVFLTTYCVRFVSVLLRALAARRVCGVEEEGRRQVASNTLLCSGQTAFVCADRGHPRSSARPHVHLHIVV